VTRLVFVRHGESQVTVNRVIGGHRTCSGLSALGRQQAERLRGRWAANAEFVPDVVIASHYPRAQETAQIVLPALGALPLTIDDGFGEHDPGPTCDGMTYDEYVERFKPPADGFHDTDPFATVFVDGETVAAFAFRVGAAVRRVTQKHNGATVAIFCHAGVIDTVLRQALKAPATDGFEIRTLNTSITEMELVRPNRWRLHRYNDAAHLAGLPAETPRAVGG